jgi:allophanate hydrolase
VIDSLLIPDLLAGYRSGRFRPTDVAREVLDRIARAPERNAWIARLPSDAVMARARALEERSPDSLPLYGVPFAVKDNIDLANVPTTAACSAFTYVPPASAAVVDRLLAAGALPVGKTNLDQFATGLVGTRSPYGACKNAFDPAFVSGGSSSGSAVAVASGLISFGLGTDTAGSGRVPAAFNNLIGLKPSCGRLSTRGVVPACRSLDCVSIFALTASDAGRVLSVAEGFDPQDPFSRPAQPSARPIDPAAFRFGVPRPDQLEFFGDAAYAALFQAAAARLASLGGQPVVVDLEPFLAAARLLYEGAWIAERYAALEPFLKDHADALHPVTRRIIEGGKLPSAVDLFRSQYRMAELKRTAGAAWRDVDLLLLPTTGTIYRIAEVEADPVQLNTRLGRYTNFVNLLDLAAVAVPAGFRSDGLPFGVTLMAPAHADRDLLALAGVLHHATGVPLGATDQPCPTPEPAPIATDAVRVAVCGAHLEGLALHHQLQERRSRLVQRTRTAPAYRFYALPGGPPERPGLLRVAEGGAAIEVEVWEMPADRFGSFVAAIPAPLGIGKLQLEDGTWVTGFICEPYGLAGAADITSTGGWRRHLRDQGAV